ncbi:MAG TPA: hypothetical protein VGN11_11355 [Candidatus Baltobacteraceae bacterium]|nr:hypothetical protein [Candidatus Baltobacteraceae bacterium]
MRTLSEVFAPGAPTLPEGLRTLVVSPDRELEPGMTVRAAFTFRNQGGASASGVRVRFNIPDGLVYLVGTGQLDGVDQDDQQGNSPILSRSGAHIGDVAPGEERRIEIAYSVAGAIENGTTIELQAAVASFEVPPVGSNVIRLIARSRPQLQNALTGVTIEARQEPSPGTEAQITVRLHNAGESSAHDVVVVAPIPEHTAYVANSARVNGREIERDLGLPFDRVYAPIVAASLPASASATLVYRVRIDTPLADSTKIVANAQVASQESAAFALEPSSLTVHANPEFDDERSTFLAEPGHEVRPGSRVVFTLCAHNSGSAAAESVTASFELPDALTPVRGGTHIDGRPIRDRKKDQLTFDLGRIDADERVEVRCEAIVASPLSDGASLETAAVLAWEPAHETASSRRFERTIAVRSEPSLSTRRNTISRTSRESVKPGEEVETVISIANDGSASATDAVLHLRVDPAFEEVRLTEKNARITLDPSTSSGQADTAEIGTLEAYAQRRFTVRARLRSPYADRSEVRIGASVHSRELGESALGEVTWRVDSHPAFSLHSSALHLDGDEALRPNQLAGVGVRITNVGSDVAHNVRVRLYVSPEARLESVDGATREKSKLVFGEIAPGATAQARLGLRLLRSLAKEYPVTVDAVLTADAMLPVPLERLTIVTTAEPDFSVGSLRSEPVDVVDVGETIEWVLHVRNGGDGPARRVAIAVAQPESLIYVPNSTTVNDVPIRDVGAHSALASDRGIVLNDVDPAVEATIRWRDVIHNGLPAGEAIVRVAHVSYDGDRIDELQSNELKARATPVFANAIPGLPFGLDGMIGPSFGGAGVRALTEERYMELPPATPVNGEGNGAMRHEWIGPSNLPALQTSHGGRGVDESSVLDGTLVNDGVGVALAFTNERLARTLRFLEEARFDGLVTHLFAVRGFFPDAIGDAHLGSLTSMRDTLREELDRLFIKLRVPSYVIAPRDIETPSLRSTLERLMHEMDDAHGLPPEAPGATFVVRGTLDIEGIVKQVDTLRDAQLASALPWAMLARTLPDGTAQLAHYRGLLIDRLDALADAEPSEFLDALQRRRDPALDGALDVVRTALYANAG